MLSERSFAILVARLLFLNGTKVTCIFAGFWDKM